MVVRFKVIKTGEIIEKWFYSEYNWRKFIYKARYSKRITLLSYYKT